MANDSRTAGRRLEVPHAIREPAERRRDLHERISARLAQRLTARESRWTVVALPPIFNAMSKFDTASDRSKRSGSARRVLRVAGSPATKGQGEDEHAAALSWLGGSNYWFAPHVPAIVDTTLPSGALAHGAITVLVGHLASLTQEEIAQVLAVSTRTLRRYRETPQKRVPIAVAAKAWTFAETLAKASDIFGGQEQAKRWISRPATGLDGRRPIDLLRSQEGTQLVGDFLGRLEHGVYG